MADVNGGSEHGGGGDGDRPRGQWGRRGGRGWNKGRGRGRGGGWRNSRRDDEDRGHYGSSKDAKEVHIDDSQLLGLLPDHPEVCTVEATVVTGMEPIAAKECGEKLGAKAILSRGRIIFDMPVHRVHEVFQLRAVDNVFVMLDLVQNFSWTGNKELDLDRVADHAYEIKWDKGLEVWKNITKFEGIVYPVEPRQCPVRRAKIPCAVPGKGSRPDGEAHDAEVNVVVIDKSIAKEGHEPGMKDVDAEMCKETVDDQPLPHPEAADAEPHSETDEPEPQSESTDDTKLCSETADAEACSETDDAEPQPTDDGEPHPESTHDADPCQESDMAEPQPESTDDAKLCSEAADAEPPPESTDDAEPHPESTDDAEPHPESTDDADPHPESTDDADPHPESTDDADPHHETDLAEPQPESTDDTEPHPETEPPLESTEDAEPCHDAAADEPIIEAGAEPSCAAAAAELKQDIAELKQVIAEFREKTAEAQCIFDSAAIESSQGLPDAELPCDTVEAEVGKEAVGGEPDLNAADLDGAQGVLAEAKPCQETFETKSSKDIPYAKPALNAADVEQAKGAGDAKSTRRHAEEKMCQETSAAEPRNEGPASGPNLGSDRIEIGSSTIVFNNQNASGDSTESSNEARSGDETTKEGSCRIGHVHGMLRGLAPMLQGVVDLVSQITAEVESIHNGENSPQVHDVQGKEAAETENLQDGEVCSQGALEPEEADDSGEAGKIDDRPGVLKFRVTCYRSGKHAFSSMDVSKHFGGTVQDKFSWKVNMTKHNLEVVISVDGDRIYTCLSLTKESLHRRNITHFGPTTLRATICYNMLRLAEVGPGDVVIDPMCGGGSIPIEGALALPEAIYIGADMFDKAWQRTFDNMILLEKKLGKRLLMDVCCWDTCRLPLRNKSIDVFVTDMPFGKRMGSTIDNKRLYPRVLHELARVCRPATGRAVILTKDKTNMIKAAQQFSYMWKTARIHGINIGGLKGTVFVLHRTASSGVF